VQGTSSLLPLDQQQQLQQHLGQSAAAAPCCLSPATAQEQVG
jgi:hypothetical protein